MLRYEWDLREQESFDDGADSKTMLVYWNKVNVGEYLEV